jgi:hypothetical protein
VTAGGDWIRIDAFVLVGLSVVVAGWEALGTCSPDAVTYVTDTR